MRQMLSSLRSLAAKARRYLLLNREPAAVITAIYTIWQAAVLVQPKTLADWLQIILPATASGAAIRQLVTPTGRAPSSSSHSTTADEPL